LLALAFRFDSILNLFVCAASQECQICRRIKIVFFLLRMNVRTAFKIFFSFSSFRMNARTTSEFWQSPARPTCSCVAPTASTPNVEPTRPHRRSQPPTTRQRPTRRARHRRASASSMKNIGCTTSFREKATALTIQSTIPLQFLQVKEKNTYCDLQLLQVEKKPYLLWSIISDLPENEWLNRHYQKKMIAELKSRENCSVHIFEKEKLK